MPDAPPSAILTLEHLRAFLEVADRRSVQAAARATGRSRTTYLRWLAELREAFGAPELLERAPGQRRGVLTSEGEELARRARAMIEAWERWCIGTHDALEQSRGAVRVGTLPGSFDLIADLLTDLRTRRPEVALRIVEYPDERLVDALEQGEVDVGFGTLDPARLPGRVDFEPFGRLAWAVILPRAMKDRFPRRLRLRDLDNVPLVVTRGGPARARLERYFAEYDEGPLVLNPAFEVGSTPRMVEMVARGFGPAIVSRFRLAFIPPEVEARPLLDGPAPLIAGAFTRRGATLPPAGRELVAAARSHFRALNRAGENQRGRPPGSRRPARRA